MKKQYYYFTSILIFLFIILLLNNNKRDNTINIGTSIDSTKIIKNQSNFGIDTTDLKRENFLVKRNDTFARILSRLKLSNNIIYKAQNLANKKFDLKKIIRGHNYFTYISSKNNSLKYFIYEISPTKFLSLNLDDTLDVNILNKKVKYVKKNVSGIINNSLYVSLQNENTDTELAIKLSEIFAWQIDFYRIQKGDKFKVIYEQEYVDDKPIGIGKIIGAYFKHKKEEFYAFRFPYGDKPDYYDKKGNSLRKAFLKAPIRFSRISSRFTYRRFHPVQKRYKAHLGTDYAAPQGTPIHSVGDGVIIAAKYSKFNGNYVKVKHNGTYTTQYLHMVKIAKGIKPGVSVKQGQTIGYVGHTGLAKGNHVDFRFWKNGQLVDPFKQNIPSSKPLSKKYIETFTLFKNKIEIELNNIKFPVLEKQNTASL